MTEPALSRGTSVAVIRAAAEAPVVPEVAAVPAVPTEAPAADVLEAMFDAIQPAEVTDPAVAESGPRRTASPEVPATCAGADPPEPPAPRDARPRAVTHALGGAFLGDPGSLSDMRPAAVRQSVGQAVRRRHDFECEAFVVGGLHVAAASLRGLSHSWDGRPNQDSFYVGLSDDERWVIAVVADGVSAAALADLASEATAREAWRAVRDSLGGAADPLDVDWASVGDAIQRRVLARGRQLVAALATGDAAEGDLPPETIAQHFASTAEAVLVEVRPDAAGVRRVARLPIAGDSTCATLDQLDPEEPAWLVWSAGKDLAATVASNAVRPIPLPQPQLHADWRELLPHQVLAVVTDGIGDPLADGSTLTGVHLADRWRAPLSAVKFLDSCAFVVAGGEDDRTAVAVWA